MNSGLSQITELTTEETAMVCGGEGDTIWVRDIWYINGQEVWVVKEMVRGENGRYQWSGEWKKIEAPTGTETTPKLSTG